MRALSTLGGLALVGLCSTAAAYEWFSHNSMAAYARELAKKALADPDLAEFLDVYGKEDLDTRAGDEHEGAFTDEDHNEGKLDGSFGICLYVERDCSELAGQFSRTLGALPCTFDHFFPRLSLPFVGQATDHARYYFNMAVKLYKAGKCNPNPDAPGSVYFMFAARALGHAIHLVEDMGSPQHALPENHAPYPVGHGKSFHEYWALDVWGKDNRRLYTRPDGTDTAHVGGFEIDAQKAANPRKGKLEGIMGSMAAESRRFLAGSPYEPGSPGSNLLLNELTRMFADSDLKPGPQTTRDEKQHPIGWQMPTFSTRSFPTYGADLLHNERHIYATSVWLAGPDYVEIGTDLPIERGQISVKSFELAERMWAQVDATHPENPINFDNKFHTLIEHTTEAAAGAILAFWDEVKDYQCQCEDMNPCGAGATSAGAAGTGVKAMHARAADAQFCRPPPRPGPYPPGRDSPDDTQGVVGNVSAVRTTSVSQYDSVELGKHWPQIAAVGVEKALPSLVDFGRTMRLLVEAQEEALTEAGNDEIARGMAEMEMKYSVHRTSTRYHHLTFLILCLPRQPSRAASRA